MTSTTHTDNVIVPLLNFCIILTANATEVPGEDGRVMNTILALVRDTVIDEEFAVERSEYSFNVCETLKHAVRGMNPGVLCESKMAMKDSDEVVRSTLRAFKFHLDEEPGGDECFTTLMSEIIRRGLDLQELPSLMVDAILSSDSEGKMIHFFSAGGAQMLIDAIDKALHVPDLSPVIRKQCLELLCRTCGHHALLPTALQFRLLYDQCSDPVYRGGQANVWKGEYRGQDVAVRVIRTYSNDEVRRVVRRFCTEVVMWRSLRHPNILELTGASMSGNRFAMVSEWMPNGDINQFVGAHPEVNRFKLLADVAKGLIYLHTNGMVHGDLKNANTLVDQTGQALLADFGLLTIIPDPATIPPSSQVVQGGSVRWMSPELIDPESFGLEKSNPTKSSDCYAFAMVIYETISGKLPFHRYTDFTVPLKVMRGERPRREAEFKDSVWEMLESCWSSNPDYRPSIEGVLRCLEAPAQRGLLLKQAFEVLSWQIIFLLFIPILVVIYH